MKTHSRFWARIVLVFGAVLTAAVIYAVAVALSSSGAQKGAEKARATLKKQGFKTDLSEFDFSVPANELAFETALRQALPPRGVLPSQADSLIRLMEPAGEHSAVVLWKQDTVRAEEQELSWEDFTDSLEMNQPGFLAARTAILAEPVRFNLEASRGMAMLLRHLPEMKNMSFALSAAMEADLHASKLNDAFTNLLADTRLVTAWQPEATEISHLVRFGLTTMAYNATWEALQHEGWRQEQLAMLEQEWRKADFLRPLPETLAFKRAGAVEMCRQQRRDPAMGMTLSETFKEMMHSPGNSVGFLRSYWQFQRYRSYGTFEDEKDLLLFYRDREVQLKQAIQAPSWSQMMPMPGVTNRIFFFSRFRGSRLQTMLNMREMGVAVAGLGPGLLGRAVEAETRRRIILTALALEQFRLREESYPKSLGALVPHYLPEVPIDLMDGRPLRYQLAADGRFLLYSVGLDTVDNGGRVHRDVDQEVGTRQFGRLAPSARPSDLVWPMAATTNEIARLLDEQARERQAVAEEYYENASQEYWERTARRQLQADHTFSSPPATVNSASANSEHLSAMLRNPNSSGTNELTLAQMLTLHPVNTGAEPETLTFEAPIQFDALKQVGRLVLYLDSLKEDDSDEGLTVAQMDCERATNGDCLLAWHTIFETPGRHTLLMGLELNNEADSKEFTVGPPASIVLSNICQFSVTSASYDSAVGAIFLAKLPEPNATYSVEMLSPRGEHLKKIEGSTTNGILNVFWDLMGDDHRKLADQSFNTVFHVKLSRSGRSETFRGP